MGAKMNDFTLEELEYLMRKFMLTNGDDFEHNLEAKLQKMIDQKKEFELMKLKGISAEERIFGKRKA